MKDFILLFVISALLIGGFYALALTDALRKQQGTTVYWLFLAIQVMILLYFISAAINATTGSNDAAGRGISTGYAFLYYIAWQGLMSLIVLLIFVFRKVNFSNLFAFIHSHWLAIGVILLIAALLYIVLCVDLKGIFLSLNSTNEKELELENGIMYTPDKKTFTGKAVFKGYMGEDEPEIGFGMEEIDEARKTRSYLEHREVMRISRYKNGLKEGTEKLYSVYHWKRDKGSKFLYRVSEYHEGLKHGNEKIYNQDKGLRFEVSYAYGKLHGLCKEYYPAEEFMPANIKLVWGNEKDDRESFADRMFYNPPVDENTLAKEVEYNDGEARGLFRTYDMKGNIMESYVYEQDENRIISGCRWIRKQGDEKHRLEWYEDGKLIATRTFDSAPTFDYRNFEKTKE